MHKAFRIGSLCLATLIGFSGCNSNNGVTGNLQLRSAVEINSTRGLTRLEPGSYATEIRGKGNDGVRVRIHAGNRRIEFDAPQFNHNRTGRFHIPASAIRQNVSLDGTVRSESEQFSRTVSRQCIRGTSDEYVCRDEYGRRVNEYETGRHCNYEPVIEYGSQDFIETGDRIRSFFSINLVGTSNRILGVFNGGQTGFETVHSTTVSGPCL